MDYKLTVDNAGEVLKVVPADQEDVLQESDCATEDTKPKKYKLCVNPVTSRQVQEYLTTNGYTWAMTGYDYPKNTDQPYLVFKPEEKKITYIRTFEKYRKHSGKEVTTDAVLSGVVSI